VNNAADDGRAWFLRLPTDIVKSAYVMDNASAADWRVLLTICQHQGWKRGPRYRKTFPLAIARTAEEARCDRRTVFRSVDWWCEMGALRKTKDHRRNVYEIMLTCQAAPVQGDAPRHITPRRLKRDDRGHFMPSDVTRKVTPHGTREVTPHGTPNQKSLSEVLYQNPPSPPRGNCRAPETVARQVLTITESTLREILKIKTKAQVIDMLKQGNYPIPEFLLGGGEVINPNGQDHDPPSEPDQKGEA
jgi:hypothetical protein